MKKKKPETFWAIYAEHIGLLPFTIRMTRRECKREFCKGRDWETLKYHGYAVVKVKVEIL